MLNRTREVDLSNYVENGEWYLVSIKIQRNVVRTSSLFLLKKKINGKHGYFCSVCYCSKGVKSRVHMHFHTKERASFKQRLSLLGVLRMLSRAFPGRYIHREHQTAHPVLSVQCHLSVHHDVRSDASRLLPPSRLRRKDHHGHHCAPCLQVSCWRTFQDQIQLNGPCFSAVEAFT